MRIAEFLQARSYRPKGIVHVGAHTAQEMEPYLALCPALIVWIEADAALLSRLRARIAQAAEGSAVRQLVIEALIVEIDGLSLDFHRFSNDGASSSIFPATERLTQEWPDVVETGEVVHLTGRRLASVLAEHDIQPPDIDVLVFDVQGAELRALAGAGEYLQAASYVEVEVSQEEIYRGAPLAGDVDHYLTGQGFELISDVPWHGDAVYGRPSQQPTWEQS